MATVLVSGSWIPVPAPKDNPHNLGVTPGRGGCIKRWGRGLRTRYCTTSVVTVGAKIAERLVQAVNVLVLY